MLIYEGGGGGGSWEERGGGGRERRRKGEGGNTGGGGVCLGVMAMGAEAFRAGQDLLLCTYMLKTFIAVFDKNVRLAPLPR